MNAGVAMATATTTHPARKPMTCDPIPTATTRSNMTPPATTTRRSCEPERLELDRLGSTISSCLQEVGAVSKGDPLAAAPAVRAVMGEDSVMDIEGMPEEERLAVLASLEALHPGLSKTASGTLAGPATRDRPNVPIWDYEQYGQEHLEVKLEDLVAVRFPVIFYGGEDFTIDSAAERLRKDPVAPAVPVTLASVLDLWKQLHAAGVVAWDHDRRAVEHVRPQQVYDAVLARWGTDLQPKPLPPGAR